MQPDQINAEPPKPENTDTGAKAALPKTIKQRVLDELKELGFTIGFLAASLCILQTYKSLILLQQGTNDFVQNYVFAIVEAVMLGKIVVIAQHLPFLKPSNKHSLARTALVQSL